MGIIKLIKNYWKLGHKEFMKRAKEGAEAVTPLQQAKANLLGQWIVILGLSMGVIVTPVIKIKGIWVWGEVILVGTFIISIISLLSMYQRYWALKKQEEIIKRLEKKK